MTETITIACQGCGEPIGLATSQIGKRLECGDCGRRIPWKTQPEVVKWQDHQRLKKSRAREQLKRERAEHAAIRTEAQERELAIPRETQQSSLPTGLVTRSALHCPACESTHIFYKRHTTGPGWALFIIGVAGLLVFFLGFILILAAMCLTERRGHCRDCRWIWKI